MITGRFFPFLTIAAVVFLVNYISGRKELKKYFKFIPPVFWIYLIPMILSTAGIIDPKSPVFQTVTVYLLPASLVLLLLSSDIKAIKDLGRMAILMMLSGSVGIMIGVPAVFWLIKDAAGSHMWPGFGALSGSWTGGSANMIAVKEAIGAPDDVFLPMVIVDTIVPYFWMGILIFASRFQEKFDVWNKVDHNILKELGEIHGGDLENKDRGLKLSKLPLIILIGFISAVFSGYAGNLLPEVKGVLSSYTWTIISATTMGIIMSFTGLKKLSSQGASETGYFALYLVLASIGAKTTVRDPGSAIILIFAGILIVLIHAVFVLSAARVLKAPMFLVATASQANIGGVASAPVVAAIYQPGLAAVGLVMAVMGNIMGTYLGIVISRICYFLK